MTLIDGKVVAKAEVLDDTSMVVRKGSADRELAVLSQQIFWQLAKT